MGHITDMPAFYCAIDRFVLPSLREGLPLCLLEAQACGTPVIATNVGAVSEAVCPETGILVDSGNEKDLAAAMRRSSLLSKPNQPPRLFTQEIGCREKMFDSYLSAYDMAG